MRYVFCSIITTVVFAPTVVSVSTVVSVPTVVEAAQEQGKGRIVIMIMENGN
jgi:hypothetical protein